MNNNKGNIIKTGAINSTNPKLGSEISLKIESVCNAVQSAVTKSAVNILR